MLEKITIHNYCSIQDLTVNLTFDEGKAPNGWKKSEWLPFVGDGKSGRYVPVLAIYGANASGKSNIIHALSNFQKIMNNGIEGCYQPYRLSPDFIEAPASYGFAIRQNDVSYLYELVYEQKHILKETLIRQHDKAAPVVIFSIEKGVFSVDSCLTTASYTQEKLQEIWRVECHDDQQEQTKAFLACLNKGYAGLSEDVKMVMTEVMRKMLVMQRNNLYMSTVIDQVSPSQDPEDIQDSFAKIVSYLQKFDLHIQEMKLNRQVIPQEAVKEKMTDDQKQKAIVRYEPNKKMVTVERITSFHKSTDGTLVPFNFYAEESQGTQLLAGIIGIVLKALEEGTRLFVDELDRSLHPLLLLHIVRMFKNKELNTKGAQLVFTLHETTLLEDPLLRLSEVGILNNNIFVGTKLQRLSDFHKDDKSVRNILNFRRRYMDGIYAGIPRPML